MSNTKKAVEGDIVRYVLESTGGLTNGKLYFIQSIVHNEGSRGACFKDDNGNERAFWFTDRYEVVGKMSDLQPAPVIPSLSDIHGQAVKVGDYIAYAFAGGRYASQSVFEVVRISTTGKFAVCRSVTDSTAIELGVFDQRALKLKDYAA